MRKLYILTAASVLSVAACGGGDSEDGNLIPPPPGPSDELALCSGSITGLTSQTTKTDIQFWLESRYRAGQPVSIIATLPDNQHTRYQWRQLTGPGVELVNGQSPVLGMELPQSGDYQFELTVERAGLTQTAAVSITAAAQDPNGLNIRLDHQVAEGDGISLRLDDTGNSAAADWCQVSGPTVKVDLSETERPIMSAPYVSQDSLVHIRATRGSQQDDVYLLITNEPTAASDALFDPPLARVHPFSSQSPYANALSKCIYNTQVTLAQCTVNELPLIGQQTSTPDIDTIMDRVLVSHDWMGDNFKAFLQTKDPRGDFVHLLKSVTAVVISYDIRPSFYWVATGAIYLDPNDLWLTPAQRDTINEAPDYRTGFGNDLQFLMPWRYVKNNDYASQYFSPAVRVDRTLDDIEPDLASLLYHELAHANDFFPTSIHADISERTLYDAFVRRNQQKQLISDQLTRDYPLRSEEMRALAQVRFMGETASNTQKAYLPADVTGFFSADIASDFYAYSTPQEDAAMLFEEAMMSHRLGIQRDVAVTNAPDDATAATVIVDWGQRGRIGESSLEDRAALVLEQMIPGIDGPTLVRNLPPPLPMRPGVSWGANLQLDPMPNLAPVSGFSQGRSKVQPPLRFSGDRHRQTRQ
ncbi:PKD domain-containing protein [Shewanella sp. GXUN23E]|uniref:PKD domain-containing protein n=1 Tax=Shewanella sp. GXUN23E TaxID=3422498 RepID=UPI003D7CAE86